MHQHLFIIGTMKGGSSSLFAMLARHPMIAASSPKEPYFFASNHTNQAEGLTDPYLKLFAIDDETRYLMDGSTDYSKAPMVAGVPARMKAFLGDQAKKAKFIYILRDPVARIQSHLRHVNLTGSDLMDRPLEDGITREHILRRALEVSRYAGQLGAYEGYFDRDQFHILTLEALQADPKRQISEIMSFLELPFEASCTEMQRENSSDDVEEWQNLPSYYSALTENAFIRAVKNFIPPAVKQKFRKAISKGKASFPLLSAAEEQNYRRAIEQDMKKLQAEWQVDISPWKSRDNDDE